LCGAAQAAPLPGQPSPAFSLVVPAGFCGVINGKFVCGDKKAHHAKHGDDDDDDADDDHHQKKGEGKHEDEPELTQCTIQEPGGGGGCTEGFKHVCEKMKNGKKCCGCVPKKPELTQCTIQSPSGGMGCVAPLKLVCEKLKSGKKCCGCVPDKNAQAPANVPETPKVDQASCAKEGLQYIAGAGDKCYCPNGFVNKATGLPAATHRSDCVTAKSYNQLDSTGAQTTPATPTAKQVCCSADIFGPDHKKKGGTADCSDSEEKAKTRIRDDFAASQGGTDILGQITCGEPH
jgi:hypothetical protein